MNYEEEEEEVAEDLDPFHQAESCSRRKSIFDNLLQPTAVQPCGFF